MDRSSDEQNPIDRLAEEFLACFRRGERPSVAEFVERYPECSDEIRELFPALVMMERLKPGPTTRNGIAAKPSEAGRPLDRLGDYLILREVGRGGMGIVYEAVQESLGRHVALKVLPHSQMDPCRLERFRREARSAAGLHHTHIVPVFGVGEQNGIHYYAMQYIHGQGLDKVLEDVRKLRNGEKPGPEVPGSGSITDATTAEVALGLLTGRFQSPAPDLRAQGGDRTSPFSSNRDFTLNVELPGPRPAEDLELPASSALSGLSGSRYVLSVARVGVQVAEALAYAHGKRILHRDIKPSNLLLDANGTVWVTDFGLAKSEEAEGLTAPHDIVGTLRFMAPERFDGCSDPRGDIYALGATLYELLTLHPAFEVTARAQLIERVLHREPPRPRQFDPDIPRDLETIVLKAMAKDPATRYATASALAEDLERFLEGRSIRARKTSLSGQAWRWCRRNPVVASLAAAVGVLVVALAVGSTAAALWLGRSRAAVQKNLVRAEVAERERTVQLWKSYHIQARAGRLSHQVGQRLDGLEALAKAARIRVTSSVREEAIACLSLIDIRRGRTLGYGTQSADMIDFDPTLERYAIGDERGEVRIRSTTDDRELIRLPGHGQSVVSLHFSPGGRHLAVMYRSPTHGFDYVLWGLERKVVIARLIPSSEGHDYNGFSPDGLRFVLGRPDGTIGVFETATGRELKRLSTGPRPTQLAFHPDGRQLAVTSLATHEVRVIDVERDEVVWKQTMDAGTSGVAWSDDGRLLAVGCYDLRVHVWDRRKDRLQSVLEGHTGLVVSIDFAGDLLLTTAWDGTTRFWDPVRGKLLMNTEQGPFWVGSDGRQVVFLDPDRVPVIWELLHGQECRVLHHGRIGNRTRRPGAFGPYFVDYSPDGRLLSSAGIDGIWIWDAITGDELAFLPGGSAGCARFSPDNSHLLTSDRKGLRLWPIRPEDDAAGNGLRIGPPRTLQRLPNNLNEYARADWDATGRRLVATDHPHGQAVVMDLKTSRTTRLGSHPGIRHVAMSPDGHWVATSTWFGEKIKVWDVAKGTPVWEHPCLNGLVTFSPDGRWLATTESYDPYCRLWRVGSWDLGAAIPATERIVSMAFSPDGTLLALCWNNGRIQLVDPNSGRRITTLTAPPDYVTPGFCALSFSPDGSQLAASTGDYTVLLWDLRLIREQLAAIGLDWEWPPFPPQPRDEAAPRPWVVRVEEPTLLAQQGREHALAGRWEKASADFARAIELEPWQQLHWFYQAPLLLEIGDTEGYRKHCRQMLDRFITTSNPWVAERTAKACLLRPVEGDILERSARLADRAVALGANHPDSRWFHLAKGMAEYRQGHDRGALESLERSRSSNLAYSRKSIDPLALLFEAMAYHRLGRSDDALHSYDLACWLLDSEGSEIVLTDPNRQWQEWLICEIIRREAETTLRDVLLDRSFPVIPFVGGYYVAPDVLEGESLFRKATSGRATPQDMRGFGSSWSGGEQLLWRCMNQGGTLMLLLPVKRTGDFELSLALTESYDFGIVSLSLDGQTLGAPRDLYSPEVVHEEVCLGRVTLSAGPHLFLMTVIDKNTASTGYFVGLDWIKLDPVR